MYRLINWCKENILFLITLALLVFIPLYPKLPLIDIQNTWVYIRAEDFFVLFALTIWFITVIRKKLLLRTPLTTPILIFWLIGGLATIHGILLIFPVIANVYPNVALFSYLRRIEYMSLYFISYYSTKNTSYLRKTFTVIVLTLLLVCLYGLGQRYLKFPAFLTMNEEFAKGIPLVLSPLSRIPSTFGGHYDLAAYCVLIIPIIVSVMLGLPNRLLAGLLGIISFLGLYILFLTVSRISLVALGIGILFVLYFHKKRIVLFILPFLILSVIALGRFAPNLIQRYTHTLQEVDVLVDAQNGQPIGHTTLVPNTYFENKVIRQQNFKTTSDLELSKYTNNIATAGSDASSSGIIIPYTNIPTEVALLKVSSAPTGEDLPEGTGYVNLTLSPVIRKLNQFYYELKPKSSGDTIEVSIINGPYLIKRTLAYDLSFTTRFQGEWPNALSAFKRNILFGSGYGSVSLAVDNSFLRMLGEVGIFGLLAFTALIIISVVTVIRAWKYIDDPFYKHFFIGCAGGVAGLMINALFIDVFEASKIAFLFWLLVGIVLGAVRLYHKTLIRVDDELFQILKSPVTIMLFLVISAFSLLGSMVSNYLIGDDFTWFRWAADCPKQHVVHHYCPVQFSTVIRYFTDAGGFFYRPGTKLYFLSMYSFFWLNPNVYHNVSLGLHIVASILVFLVAWKLLLRKRLAAAVAFIYLIIAGYTETVFWISATGHLISACLTLAGLLWYICWSETKNVWNYALALSACVLAPLFHESGIVIPLVLILYRVLLGRNDTQLTRRENIYQAGLFVPIPLYIIIRTLTGSHGLSGDYNYNLVKLPFNILGNLFGYLVQSVGGPLLKSVYDALRTFSREHYTISTILTIIIVLILIYGYRNLKRIINDRERNIVLFSFGFIIIVLLPFLGLGNITSRYGYTAIAGVSCIVVLFFQKLYTFLAKQEKDIAICVVVILTGIFGLLHIVQLQKVQDNWSEAGNKVNQFFVSIDSQYEDTWIQTPLEFHFVDVPIKNGEAWVFPVGLPDAVWFAFRNPQIRVYQDSSVENALSDIQFDSPTQKVFVFEKNGMLTEYKKTRSDQ